MVTPVLDPPCRAPAKEFRGLWWPGPVSVGRGRPSGRPLRARPGLGAALGEGARLAHVGHNDRPIETPATGRGRRKATWLSPGARAPRAVKPVEVRRIYGR